MNVLAKRSSFLLSLAIPMLAMWGCTTSTTTPEVKTGNLVVSQLMFRAASDSLEWLEIQNVGDGPAALAGIKIAAVGYQFPATTPALAPGARWILTNDEALFAKRYPGVRIGDVYTSKLSNEGESVELDGAEGKDFQFSYGIREPWPAGPELVGTSLVYMGGDPESPTSWKSSLKAGGSPGAVAATSTDKGIWISEVRPADSEGKGFVELASASSTPIDLSGWILGHSPTTTKSDTLPAGTSIPAYGRLVLHQIPAQGELGWGGVFPAPNSGELALFERGTDGFATGNVHTIAWGAIPDGMSVGKVGTIGSDARTALIGSPTPGTADATRRLGLVSITEVCYQPDSGNAEFVEIQNETDSVIHLGYPADTSRSWRLSGTGKTFQSSDTLAPRGRLVLVSKSDMTPDGFRAKWNIPATVGVVAFSGKLDNSGEILELKRPWVAYTTQDGGLSWKSVVEDDATWSVGAPWPAAAAGGGSCLARSDRSLPGTAPAAWIATKPTPGF